MFSLLLQELEENKSYVFKIVHDGWNNTNAQLYYYKNFDTKQMTIINGGDIGNVQTATNINNNVVAKINADLIFVGGDIAYDNAFAE